MVVNETREAARLDLAPACSTVRASRHQVIANTSKTQRAELSAASLADRTTRPPHDVAAGNPQRGQNLKDATSKEAHSSQDQVNNGCQGVAPNSRGAELCRSRRHWTPGRCAQHRELLGASGPLARKPISDHDRRYTQSYPSLGTRPLQQQPCSRKHVPRALVPRA